MQKVNNNRVQTTKSSVETMRRDEVNNRLKFAATAEKEMLFDKLGTLLKGLSGELAEASGEQYGGNRVTHGRKVSLFKRVCMAFINPFTAILFVLAMVSYFTDIILAEPGEANPITVIIIMTMVLFSGFLRFVQETRSGNAAEKLLKMIKTTTCVERQEARKTEIPLEEVVVGDIVHLAAGDMIPADMRIISAKDLFVSQSAASRR